MTASTKAASLNKTAVDAFATDYWSTYFGDYGRAWVRDIPRRIKKALLDRKVAAAGGDGEAQATIVPFGYAVKADRLDFEGVAKLDGGKQLLFVASFDHEGNLHDLVTRDAPSASAR